MCNIIDNKINPANIPEPEKFKAEDEGPYQVKLTVYENLSSICILTLLQGKSKRAQDQPQNKKVGMPPSRGVTQLHALVVPPHLLGG